MCSLWNPAVAGRVGLGVLISGFGLAKSPWVDFERPWSIEIEKVQKEVML